MLANFPFSGPSPQTPEGFEVRTPVAEEDNAAFSQLQDATFPLTPSMGVNNFEFSQIQNASPPMLPGMRSDDLPLPQSQNATSSLPPRTGMDDISLYQLQDVIPSWQDLMVPDESLFSQTEDPTHLFQRWTRTFDLPFFQLQDYLYPQGMSHKLFAPFSVPSFGLFLYRRFLIFIIYAVL